MKIAAMLTLENHEFYVVSKHVHELKTCLCHETTCVKQDKLAYKSKTQHMLKIMLKTKNFRFTYADQTGNFHLLNLELIHGTTTIDGLDDSLRLMQSYLLCYCYFS